MAATSSETNLIDFSGDDLAVKSILDASRTQFVSGSVSGFASHLPAPSEYSDTLGGSPASTVNALDIRETYKDPRQIILSSSKDPNSKASRSFFEITRVETKRHGGSIGTDNDSELDDTLSETLDSFSSPVVNYSRDHIYAFPADESNPNSEIRSSLELIQTSNIEDIARTSITACGSACIVTTATLATSSITTESSANPTSRFRIVKISKTCPYNRGRWDCRDADVAAGNINVFANADLLSKCSNEPGLRTEEFTASPHASCRLKSSKRSNDECDRNRIVSPNELVKRVSSDLSSQESLSRGASYARDSLVKRSSFDQSISPGINDISLAPTDLPIVSPVVEALDTALDQIMSIKEAMLSSVADEMSALRESLEAVRIENGLLREENRTLREKLHRLEQRLHALETG